jgi:hypothetical protein
VNAVLLRVQFVALSDPCPPLVPVAELATA